MLAYVLKRLLLMVPTLIGNRLRYAYEPARLCREFVGGARARAGAALADVVRTRIYLTDAADWEEVARAHGEVFAEIRPASTAVVVKALLDERWRVEIEADAVLP